MRGLLWIICWLEEVCILGRRRGGWGGVRQIPSLYGVGGETGYTAQEDLKSINSCNMEEGRWQGPGFSVPAFQDPPWFLSAPLSLGHRTLLFDISSIFFMSIILFFKVSTIHGSIQDSFSSSLLHFTHPETQRLKVGGTFPPFGVGWSCCHVESWLRGHVSGVSVTLLGVVAGFQLRAQLGLLDGTHQFYSWHLLEVYFVAETSIWESKQHIQRVGELRFTTLVSQEELTLQAPNPEQRDYRVFIDRL